MSQFANDIPLGTCIDCGVKQESFGEGGLWINGLPHKWECRECIGPKIRSYPMACEWCTFEDVVWYQGHTYDCPRCNELGIKH